MGLFFLISEILDGVRRSMQHPSGSHGGHWAFDLSLSYLYQNQTDLASSILSGLWVPGCLVGTLLVHLSYHFEDCLAYSKKASLQPSLCKAAC